jgi:hypothetical protein
MRAHLAIAVGVFAAACGSTTTPEVSVSNSVNSDLTRSDCGAFVSQRGNRIDVAPTGVDDTRNLQCAIDAAVASGRSASIRLSGGTFHTAQIVAKNFVGQIAGSGTAETVITTLGTPMFVTRDDFFSHGLPTPPGGENPWPSLISFIDGDFSMSDLTIRVLDPAPTTGWTVFGLDQIFGRLFQTLAGEIYIVGLSAHATFERIAFEGKNTPSDPLFGNNVYNAIFFVGEGSGPAPIAGALEVRQSAFIEVAAGAVAADVQDATVSIVGNTSQRTSWPVQIADLAETRVTVAANRFQDGLAGVQIVDACPPGGALCGISNTQLLVVGNQLAEFDGIEINATFASGVSCTVVGNDIHYDADNGGVAVLLGPATKDCRVVTKGAVRDQGTGNRVTILP